MTKRKAYSDTSVSTGDTMSQLEQLLAKSGVAATRWSMAADSVRLEIQPKKRGDAYMIELPIPYGQSERRKEQHRRQVFRVLYWYVKSKLEAIEAGVTDFQREFLAYMITGPNRTFIQEIKEAVESGAQVLHLGQESPLLPEPTRHQP